jgi:nucleoid DNA-binding protein
MRTDSTLEKIIEKVALKNRISIDEATKIVDTYYTQLTELLHQPDNTIKVNYIGRFSYSELWKNKKQNIKNETI